MEESGNSSSLAVKSKEKDKKQPQQLGHERKTKNRVEKDNKQQRGDKRNTKNRIDENDKQQRRSFAISTVV